MIPLQAKYGEDFTMVMKYQLQRGETLYEGNSPEDILTYLTDKDKMKPLKY